jgi:Fe-S oxidoreductase
LRYGPRYQAIELPTRLDWSAYPGAGGGFQGAVEMCNNNGACRSIGSGVMCPSYRATREERDVTRGRANSLRLAITGQLGPGAFSSDEMAETMSLCVSCKACRRECPTGVDMARMKIEVQAARAAARGLSLHDRLVGYLPRYAPLAARWPFLLNLRNDLPAVARLSERLTGFAAQRKLPRWRSDAFRDSAARAPRQRNGESGREVVLFADTFNRYFEPENVEAAIAVLTAARYRVHLPKPLDGARPLCCGRTFLSAGLVDEARAEAERTLTAFAPYVDRGMDVVGLEPSCVFGFRDEIPALLPREPVRTRAGKLADHVLTFEEFIARAAARGGFDPPRRPVAARALLHGHCHQKSFGTMAAVEATLRLVPGLAVDTVESSCCGMAGAFGYGADTIDVSLKMAEASLLPAVRAAASDTLVVASGTSCRHQIKDGSGREPLHVARVLGMSVTAG